MLIGLCGGQKSTPSPRLPTCGLTSSAIAICAGKHAIAEYLIQYEGFQLLELATKPSQRITDEPDDDLRFQASEIRTNRDRKERDAQSELVFDTSEALLDFVTKRWREKWVTTDIADGLTLDRFLLRPFFLLVSVDAPVSLRWKRFSDRFVARNPQYQSTMRIRGRENRQTHDDCMVQVLAKTTRPARFGKVRVMERPSFI